MTHIKLSLFSTQNNARLSAIGCNASCSPSLFLSTLPSPSFSPLLVSNSLWLP
ncbi:unnamed protein product [Hymenolepis diminuta]|uniref:Uncharacterized protein n=1 Tax=Hymenolepis diminuta TaxID=6216 RepID=A0A564YJU9_HYMDI|nr:unnamed protein product [Hymenolepis diminuta]